MEIQGDLIILPPSNHLPLPWSVRGPLGLATGTEVSLALIRSGASNRMPDIIVTPLQSKYLHQTFTVEVELGERPGAVADFLSWFGGCAETRTQNNVNVVLSETITLEGRQRHKIHLVLEPAVGHNLTKDVLEEIISEVTEAHPDDILSADVRSTYSDQKQDYIRQRRILVEEGWLKYGGWMDDIVRECGDILEEYDRTKVVVSSSPDQRLLRYIIPRKNVFELRVPHENTPGALKEIANVIRKANNNILSSRLSRTPPFSYSPPSTSVFVASCEPLGGQQDPQTMDDMFRKVDSDYMIEDVSTSPGRSAERSLYLTPRRTERVALEQAIAVAKDTERAEVAQEYFTRYQSRPIRYVFLSHRFFDQQKHPKLHTEQRKTIERAVAALEAAGCAVVRASDPSKSANKPIDDKVDTAVYARVWAGDACLVLALSEERHPQQKDDEEGSGLLSLSIAHEIGFFSGRNKPWRVLVSTKRHEHPIFGNIVGRNRLVYADGDAAFDDDESYSIYSKVYSWALSICHQS